MSETRLKLGKNTDYIEVKHGNSNNFWNVGAGTDIHSFTVPEGKQFTRYDVSLETRLRDSRYQVLSAPKRGATGKQSLRIGWYYAPAKEVKYRVHIYVGQESVLTIDVGSHNWINRALNAINQGVRHVRLRVKGREATELFRHLSLASPQFVPEAMPVHLIPDFDVYEAAESMAEAPETAEDTELDAEPTPMAEPISAGVTWAIVAGVIGVAGFATVASVLLTAINAGYCPKSRYEFKGTSIGALLDFDIVQCK